MNYLYTIYPECRKQVQEKKKKETENKTKQKQKTILPLKASSK